MNNAGSMRYAQRAGHLHRVSQGLWNRQPAQRDEIAQRLARDVLHHDALRVTLVHDVVHRDDAGMLERGDIFWNRKSGNFLIRAVASFLFRFGKSQRCRPDLYIDEGDDLSEYGFDARTLHIPGHSKGSIAMLTADGALFCGDLLEYKGRPVLNNIIDDRGAAKASFERVKSLEADTVYTGHGQSFPTELFR